MDRQRLLLSNSETQRMIQDLKTNATLTQQLEVDKPQLREIVQENVKLLLKTIFPITCEGLMTG